MFCDGSKTTAAISPSPTLQPQTYIPPVVAPGVGLNGEGTLPLVIHKVTRGVPGLWSKAKEWSGIS